jgi:hypothetical protein
MKLPSSHFGISLFLDLFSVLLFFTASFNRSRYIMIYELMTGEEFDFAKSGSAESMNEAMTQYLKK